MPRTVPVDVPVSDGQQIRTAFASKRELTAIAGTTKGKWLFLNIAFRTGDIGTVYLDPLHAGHLLRVLEQFLTGREGTERLPLRWVADGLTAQRGQAYVEIASI